MDQRQFSTKTTWLCVIVMMLVWLFVLAMMSQK